MEPVPTRNPTVARRTRWVTTLYVVFVLVCLTLEWHGIPLVPLYIVFLPFTLVIGCAAFLWALVIVAAAISFAISVFVLFSMLGYALYRGLRYGVFVDPDEASLKDLIPRTWQDNVDSDPEIRIVPPPNVVDLSGATKEPGTPIRIPTPRTWHHGSPQ